MNEELKIIITAATGEAKKGIQGVKKELGGISGSAKGASKGVGAAMKAIGTAAAVAVAAVAAVVATVVALGAALVKLGKASLDYQRAQAKLNTAFLSMGSSAQQAAESYQGLFRFLGDIDTSAEAAAHLAKLTTNQKELAEWTKICQGVYATFGDSLKIEALTESANETARVGKITGAFADAVNWAGVSEDEFNAKLAKTTSYEEREALIRSTLNGLYSDAAEIYEKNNKDLLEYNASQAKLDSSMAAAGQAAVPLLTSLNNLSAVLFDALKPAIDAIVPVMVDFVNWIAKGVQMVMSLMGAVTGASSSISAMTTGAGVSNLASGLNNAAGAAEKLKRATMGFDELNVVGSGSGSGSGSSGDPSYMAPSIGASNFTMEAEQTESKAGGLAKTLKGIAEDLKELFAPTTKAWSENFGVVAEAWNNSKESFAKGGEDIMDSLGTVSGYVVRDFVPTMVNSFSENLAPLYTTYWAFLLEEGGKTFELFGKTVKDSTDEIILPAADSVKIALSDMFEGIGEAWSNHSGIFDTFSEALEKVRTLLETLYEEFIKPICQKVIEEFDKLWKEHLEPVWDKFMDAIFEIGECVLQIYNERILPIAQWIASNIVPKIRDFINLIIEYVGRVVGYIVDAVGGIITTVKGIVQFITGVFTADWKKAWEGVKNIFKGIWDAIVGLAKAAWEGIKSPFSGEKAKKFFSDVWSGIKSAFGNVSDWFKNVFSKAWEAVKNVFSKGGKVFDGIKDGILNGLKKVINGLIDGINKVIKKPFDGINSALNTIKKIEIVGIKPFKDLPTISVPQIPKLATGGIVDRATLAMIGERGKEAVVPLENNTGWMDKLAEKLSSRQQTPSKIVLMLDGKELGWASINSINNVTRQTGALQLVLG